MRWEFAVGGIAFAALWFAARVESYALLALGVLVASLVIARMPVS